MKDILNIKEIANIGRLEDEYNLEKASLLLQLGKLKIHQNKKDLRRYKLSY